MQNDMDNYLRELARSCAKEAFEKAREKASKSDFMGINSRKVAKIVVNNRKGADDILLSLAAKAESATSLLELIPIHKAVYSILETVDCPLQRAHLGPDEYGTFRSDSIQGLNQDNCYLGNIYGLSTRPLRKWEESRSRDPEAYRTVLKQYRGMISSNAKAAAQVIQKETHQDIKQRHRGR